MLKNIINEAFIFIGINELPTVGFSLSLRVPSKEQKPLNLNPIDAARSKAESGAGGTSMLLNVSFQIVTSGRFRQTGSLVSWFLHLFYGSCFFRKT
jgi:hypothetical protein